MLQQHEIRATLPASDLERARKFYEEVLGFVAVGETPAGVDYKSGPLGFFVYPSSGQSPATFTQAGWRVDNIEEEVAQLKNNGVKFEEYDFPGLKTVNSIADVGMNRSAWFKDSEGNLLGLTQLEDNT
jgi:catechol 2,3-dioxygenase-like lactoylglutathione lyase family enzyme